MIAQLSGTVLQVGPTSAVIEVGGLGVLALCSPNTVAGLRIGQRATLATSLIVREDSLTLYGFATADEREFFELLLTATGVGPKLAQAALAVLSPDELRRAIATENLVQLCKVPGHRPQGRAADRHRAQGQDQRRPAAGRAGSASPVPRGAWRDQVTQGLQGLGWSARDAEAACDEVEPLAADDPSVSVAVLMRAALQTLARSEPMSQLTTRSSAALVRPAPTPTSGPPSRRCDRPAWPTSRGSRGSATSWAWCWRPPGTAAECPTTCCSPGRPGWARPPWP